jgi:hypothetical protein
MSRQGINEDSVVGFCSGYTSMDMINASILTLPFGKQRQPRQPSLVLKPAQGLSHPSTGQSQAPRQVRPAHDQPKESIKDEAMKEITIDVRTRCEPRPPPIETQAQLEIPGLLVPAGYAFFALCLGLSNLLSPPSSSVVCVVFSPVPIICLSIHSLSVQPWVGFGLLVCAWLAPFVCSIWRLAFCLVYFVVLGVFVGAGTRRIAASICLVALLLSMPLAINPQWAGLESRWGVTVAGFFLALQCVLASAGGGRVVYRIKQLTAN